MCNEHIIDKDDLDNHDYDPFGELPDDVDDEEEFEDEFDDDFDDDDDY